MSLNFRPDVVLELTYNYDDRSASIIKTNAKPEAVQEILEAWIHGQIGQGRDDSEAKELSEYKITIQLDMRDDTFITSSDTGNKSLTCGLVMDILRRLDNVKIEPLTSPRPQAQNPSVSRK